MMDSTSSTRARRWGDRRPRKDRATASERQRLGGGVEEGAHGAELGAGLGGPGQRLGQRGHGHVHRGLLGGLGDAVAEAGRLVVWSGASGRGRAPPPRPARG